MSISRFRLLGVFSLLLALASAQPASGFSTSSVRAGGKLVGPGLTNPDGVSDGQGGMIVLGRDRAGAAIANRYNRLGQSVWGAGMSFPASPVGALQSDGAGGAILGLQRTETTMSVARLSSSGAISWQAVVPNGVLASGGDGGVWVIGQSGELYAEGISASGAPRGRIRLTSSGESNTLPAVASDGTGGTFLAWRIARTDGTFGLQLQHLTVDGTLWSSPLAVAGTTDSGVLPVLAEDGAGGVLMSWYAASMYWVNDYAADGLSRWNHVLTVRTPGTQTAYATSDGGGGTFVTYAERRRSVPITSDVLHVAHVGASGTAQWSRSVATIDGGVLDLRVAGQPGAVTVGWRAAQIPIAGSAVDADLFVQRILSNGMFAFRTESSQRLASSAGPDSFGELTDAGGGAIYAVFSQSPCFRSDASGVAIQRIDPDGRRAFRADGACP